jgi:hypothetical protein
MDAIIRSLFEFIPEALQPYVALGLVILYVITKARSAGKSKQIRRLVVVICPRPKEGDRSIAPVQSGWDKVVDAIF